MNKNILFINILLALLFTLSVHGQKSPGNVHPSSLTAWFKTENYTFGADSWNNSADNNKLKVLSTGNPPSEGELWNYHPTCNLMVSRATMDLEQRLVTLPIF